jgi:hypothetical protein
MKGKSYGTIIKGKWEDSTRNDKMNVLQSLNFSESKIQGREQDLGCQHEEVTKIKVCIQFCEIYNIEIRASLQMFL